MLTVIHDRTCKVVATWSQGRLNELTFYSWHAIRLLLTDIIFRSFDQEKLKMARDPMDADPKTYNFLTSSIAYYLQNKRFTVNAVILIT